MSNNIGYIENKSYYKSLLNKYEDPYLVGSWGNSDPTPRYEELVERDCFVNSTILEIGCGLGGFLDYLIRHGLVKRGNYCGLDILEEMQIKNQRKYPDYRFITQNIIDDPLNEVFDIVVICGVWNIKTSDGVNYMNRLLRRGWDCCEKLLTFNYISTYVGFVDETMQYHNPMEVTKFCIENFSPRVKVNHHYWKCDTSCKVYR